MSFLIEINVGAADSLLADLFPFELGFKHKCGLSPVPQAIDVCLDPVDLRRVVKRSLVLFVKQDHFAVVNHSMASNCAR